MEPSPGLSALLGVPVWLKLENLQLTGSFKIRGAWFRISRLTPQERRSGVLTCSAGNHGKGVAYAAAKEGVPAIVCVPRSVDPVKLEGIRSHGAEVRISEFAGYDETEAWAKGMAAAEGLPFLSAFDDEAVMAGNGGTLAREFLEQVPRLQSLLLPVGGGGMGAGASFSPLRLHAAQHALSPALRLSLDRGEAVTALPAVDTAAGGIEGGIGRFTFEILRTRIASVSLLSEEEIWEGVRWMLAHHQYLVEPSAAAVVAAILCGRLTQPEGPIGVIISGRNVSLEVLKRHL
ncbi:MAG: pyridoxal-phosphate dependent enzyme [Bryobacteraceae bacterium]|nr:pyridoxal-phosphate dependent enzyme [Bryobacteraceae bacterium]